MDHHWWGSRESLALSISEAARICGVKRRAIRRLHQAGEFEHAFKDPDGTWRIPVNDLVAAGLRPDPVADPDETGIVFTAASKVDRLRTEVAILRERVRALEIIARERQERVTDLRTILRMLPAPKEASEVTPPQHEEPAPISASTHDQPLAGRASREPVLEKLQEATTPSRPPAAERMAPAVKVTSPSDAPAAPAASTEPIVILPDVPSGGSEPSEGAFERSAQLLEGARRRSAELLEDAMSLWWPSPKTRSKPEAAPSSPGRAGPAAVTPSDWERARASTVVSDKPAATATPTDTPAASPSSEKTPAPPASRPPIPEESDLLVPNPIDEAPLSDLFMPNPIDEASLDWRDPDSDRPPRHRRHRLRRFFHRHRRTR